MFWLLLLPVFLLGVWVGKRYLGDDYWTVTWQDEGEAR